MATEALGRWEPLEFGDVVHLFEDFTAPWWICGGHALELALGRSWRTHGDMDVGVLRTDASRLVGLFQDWDLEVAAAGVLSPWNGSFLRAEENQNNVWCRRANGRPWCLDITLADGNREFWVFRRDPRIQVPWKQAVLRTARRRALSRPRAAAPLQIQAVPPKGRPRRKGSHPEPGTRPTRPPSPPLGGGSSLAGAGGRVTTPPFAPAVFWRTASTRLQTGMREP